MEIAPQTSHHVKCPEEGWEWKPSGKEETLYSEESRVLFCFSTYYSDSPKQFYSSVSVGDSWWYPQDNRSVPVTPEERETIKSRIRRALDLIGDTDAKVN